MSVQIDTILSSACTNANSVRSGDSPGKYFPPLGEATWSSTVAIHWRWCFGSCTNSQFRTGAALTCCRNSCSMWLKWNASMQRFGRGWRWRAKLNLMISASRGIAGNDVDFSNINNKQIKYKKHQKGEFHSQFWVRFWSRTLFSSFNPFACYGVASQILTPGSPWVT